MINKNRIGQYKVADIRIRRVIPRNRTFPKTCFICFQSRSLTVFEVNAFEYFNRDDTLTSTTTGFFSNFRFSYVTAFKTKRFSATERGDEIDRSFTLYGVNFHTTERNNNIEYVELESLKET